MSLTINSEIFREYDIRGVASVDLSDEFAEALGIAYANHIKDKAPVADRKTLTVSVGKDCRLSSDRYENALVKGLLSGGLDVIRLGLCPTPLTYFSLFHHDLDGCIMVTASHNPPEFNGFKICVGRDAIYGDEIQELRFLMQNANKPASKKGTLSSVDIVTDYLDYQMNQFSCLKGKKIVIDCGNGMASIIVASKLFRNLGVDVSELYCQLDGTFPNHTPDPTKESNLTELIKTVKESQADFGVGFDGDADRIGVVDENGRLLPGDELMAIFSRSVLLEHPGATVISEVKSSNRLFNDIENHGGAPLMWKVGHSHLKAKIKETGAILGGELSGHICFADRYFGFDDAIYATLRLLEIAIKKKKSFSTILSDFPKAFSTPELRLPFEDRAKFDYVEIIKKYLLKDSSLSSKMITDIDGIRIDFDDGWGLVRASNTQPVLTFRFEAISEQRLLEIKLLFQNAADKACMEMDHSQIRLI
jgi:phosphomannomutase/phosphoglucomutase